MYDYLAKIILLGPSGCGKYALLHLLYSCRDLTLPRSCLLHRFVKNECTPLPASCCASHP